MDYGPIMEHHYEQYFVDVKYNGKILNHHEKIRTIQVLDDTVAQLCPGLLLFRNSINNYRSKTDGFSELYRTVLSLYQFTLVTMLDYLVAAKYFLIATNDYEKRFMRGKLLVILNEGFKKLYGFDSSTHNKSEWKKLSLHIDDLPSLFKNQFQDLSTMLECRSRSCNWWKDDRCYEIHLDVEKLLQSRNEELVEGQVMMESMRLFGALYSVNLFLTDIHTCLLQYMSNHVDGSHINNFE